MSRNAHRIPHVDPFRHSAVTVLLLTVVLLQLLTEVASRPRYSASKRYRELPSGAGNSVADEDPTSDSPSNGQQPHRRRHSKHHPRLPSTLEPSAASLVAVTPTSHAAAVADEDPLTVAASTSLAQSAAPSSHHGRSHQQPASWRQGRCIDDAVYSWCFMCGKVVESRDIYFGCCRAEKRVMTFCEQLLS